MWPHASLEQRTRGSSREARLEENTATDDTEDVGLESHRPEVRSWTALNPGREVQSQCNPGRETRALDKAYIPVLQKESSQESTIAALEVD